MLLLNTRRSNCSRKTSIGHDPWDNSQCSVFHFLFLPLPCTIFLSSCLQLEWPSLCQVNSHLRVLFGEQMSSGPGHFLTSYCPRAVWITQWELWLSCQLVWQERSWNVSFWISLISWWNKGFLQLQGAWKKMYGKINLSWCKTVWKPQSSQNIHLLWSFLRSLVHIRSNSVRFWAPEERNHPEWPHLWKEILRGELQQLHRWLWRCELLVCREHQWPMTPCVWVECAKSQEHPRAASRTTWCMHILQCHQEQPVWLECDQELETCGLELLWRRSKVTSRCKLCHALCRWGR